MIVFLDANVFIAAKYRFASKYFGSLRSLISNGDIQVIYTSATRGEVEHHIREDIKAEVEQYNRMLRKDLPLLTSFSKDTLSEVSVEDLSQAIIAGLNDFLSLDEDTLVDWDELQTEHREEPDLVYCSECGRVIGRTVEYTDYDDNPICAECMVSNSAGDICPACGRKVPHEFMINGFCIDCSEEND